MVENDLSLGFPSSGDILFRDAGTLMGIDGNICIMQLAGPMD